MGNKVPSVAGMEMHDCNPTLGRLRPENGEFKARAGKTLPYKKEINRHACKLIILSELYV